MPSIGRSAALTGGDTTSQRSGDAENAAYRGTMGDWGFHETGKMPPPRSHGRAYRAVPGTGGAQRAEELPGQSPPTPTLLPAAYLHLTTR
jgi:hypothetical protein